MATDANAIQAAGLSKDLSSISKATQDINFSIKGLENTETSELQKLYKDLKNSLGKFQLEIVNNIESVGKGFSDVKGAAQDMLSNVLSAVNGTPEEKTEKKLKAKLHPGTSDLLKLGARYSLGPLLISDQLIEIQKLIKKLIPKAPGQKNEDKKAAQLRSNNDMRGNGKGSKIGKLKGLSEVGDGLSTVVGAIQALIKLNPVKTILGMKLVSKVVDKWNTMSQKYKGNFKFWEDLNKLIMKMEKGVSKIAKVVLLLALSAPLLILAIPAAFGVGLLFKALGKLKKPVSQSIPALKDLAIASVIMAIAFLVFAGALYILGTYVWPVLPQAIAGAATILLVILAMVGISKLVGQNTQSFIQFAIGSVILGVAFMIFGGALYIISLIGNNIGPVIAGLALILVTLLACVGMSMLVQSMIAQFVMFSVGALILGVAFMVFGGALLIIAEVGARAVEALIGLAVSIAVIALAAAAGFGMMFIMPLLASFSAGAVLLGIGFTLFGLSLLILSKLGDIPMENITNAMEIMTKVFVSVALITPFAVAAVVALAAMVPCAGMMLGVFPLLGISFGVLSIIGKMGFAGVDNALAIISKVFTSLGLLAPLAVLSLVSLAAITPAAVLMMRALMPLTQVCKELVMMGQVGDVGPGIESLSKLFDFVGGLALKSLFIFGGVKALDGFGKKLNKGMKALIEPLKQVASLGDLVGADFEKTTDLFNSDGMKVFVDSMENLSGGVSTFGKSLSGLKNVGRFSEFVNSLSKLSQSESAIDKLIQFANKADSLNTIANAFGNLATSIDKIAKNEKKVKSLFDTLSKAKTDLSVMDNITIQAIGGTTFDPSVTDILQILRKWSADGIKVQGSIDQETFEIRPDKTAAASNNNDRRSWFGGK